MRRSGRTKAANGETVVPIPVVGRIDVAGAVTPGTKATTGHLPHTLTAATPTTSTSGAPAASIRPTTTIGTTASPVAAHRLRRFHDLQEMAFRL